MRLIEDLKKDNNVDIITFKYKGHENVAELKNNVIYESVPSFINCFNKPGFNPIFTKRFDKKVSRLINSIASTYDLVYFDFTQTFILSNNLKHNNIVFMCHDVVAQGFTRNKRVFFRLIKKNEKTLLSAPGISIYTFSRKDSNLLKEFYGVNARYVHFYLKNVDFKYVDNVMPDTFCFYGVWSRKENLSGLLWFVDNVLPYLKSRLHFFLIGSGLEKKMAERLAGKGFEVLGFVEDPIKIIARTQALIAPLFKGAGVKVKVIDALSIGTSVIGTEVAFEGIECPNEMFFLANQKKDYISIINSWKNVNFTFKNRQMINFVEYYNKNKFVDYLKR